MNIQFSDAKLRHSKAEPNDGLGSNGATSNQTPLNRSRHVGCLVKYHLNDRTTWIKGISDPVHPSFNQTQPGRKIVG